MNRLVALFALVAVAFAEPEADPQVYLHGATPIVYAAHHGNAHSTYGLVQHPSGAVTPDDTASVKAAKVQHHTAKVNEYLKKPFVYTAPVVSAPAVVSKPVVSYTAPVATTTYGAVTPLTYTTGYHHLLKREAESDPAYLYNAGIYSPYTYTTGYTGYPYATTYGAYGAYASPYTTYSGYHHLYKREADSDSQYFYNSAYAYPSVYGSAYRYPYTTYGAYSGLYGSAYRYPYVY